ncbi:PREDICTED: uncharacterized protein LOC109229008 isoform X3 [Nicotiana attenuata]|uniref:uncharacterized protein LOC109229008 isoform X3 n=1 Tax=Nicotiana attenuata TaxID=49451 RepID=UPI000905C67C|nr:PREDICTED: uncharacterized protein LOC109229008 isoform X3 [Nicotiana attenuata]
MVSVMKEKRWVTFKGEDDPTSIPVEWICWLNGQRKSAPTSEEMAELEARREFVKLNVARLRKEEEERKAKEGKSKATSIGKADGPDLKSFVQQFPDASEDMQDRKKLKPRKICLVVSNNNQSRQSQLVLVNPLDQEHGNLPLEITQTVDADLSGFLLTFYFL